MPAAIPGFDGRYVSPPAVSMRRPERQIPTQPQRRPERQIPTQPQARSSGGYVPQNDAFPFLDSSLRASTIVGQANMPDGMYAKLAGEQVKQNDCPVRQTNKDDLHEDPMVFGLISRGREGNPIDHGALPHADHSCPTKGGESNVDLDKHFEESMSNKFPLLFTIFCFTTFIIPVWLVYSVGGDIQVTFWITGLTPCVLILPFLYLFTHVWHIMQGKPSRNLVVVCLIGSCMLLMILSDMVLLEAYSLANKFAASDCNTFAGKSNLQTEYLAATAFYDGCILNTAKLTDVSQTKAEGMYNIQDCSGYADQLTYYPGWPYLESMEKKYHCSGWCTASHRGMWTFAMTKDSCSATAADLMYNKVQFTMLQVVVYTTVCLGFVSIMLMLAGPVLRERGVAW